MLVSTSAVGYYGVSTSDTFDEASRPGNDFLAHVCQDWEAEANKAEARVVILRSGIILAKNGGALGKMVPVFMMFGGAVSSVIVNQGRSLKRDCACAVACSVGSCSGCQIQHASVLRARLI